MNMISTCASQLPVTPFRPEGVPSLADVRNSADRTLAGTMRRDTLSAFDVLAARMDLDLATAPATAVVVRRLFETAEPARLGVTARRYANIRSLVMRAVERFGLRRAPLTRLAPLSAGWAALLECAQPHACRKGVKRLAHYCSAVGVPAEAVCLDTLLGLHAALEAESLTKEPRAIIRRTIGSWNMICRATQEWPQIVLCSPWKVEPDTFPLTHFPASFQADVARWTERMTRPDPLDPEAPQRALRPATIKGHVIAFRRFASALLRRGLVPLEGITGLAVFFEGANFREGLRHFLRFRGGPDAPPDTRYALWHARLLLHIARRYVCVEPDALAEIARICQRLDPRLPSGMGRLSRDRLEQFDEPENVARLLGFPKAEAARAMRLTNPERRARGVERALAVALLIDTSLRISNLRHIQPDVDLRRVAGRVHLTVKAVSVKNRMDLTFELADGTVHLLERFQQEHRRHLPWHDGPYLFPGKTGGPMSDPGIRQLICTALKKHCGLTMNPHLFRHTIAKIVVERDPSMYAAVSRHLGHRSMSTTLASYLGTETPAASRKLNQILRAARDNPTLGED